MQPWRYKQCMGEFFRAFIRNDDGSWRCVAPPTLHADAMRRIQVAAGSVFVPGQRFMNVDVVAMLDQYRKRVGGTSP